MIIFCNCFKNTVSLTSLKYFGYLKIHFLRNLLNFVANAVVRKNFVNEEL